MKKKIFSLIALAVMIAIGASAQTVTALLTHGSTTTTFNGYTALNDAYAKAESGDLITLSSGTFGSVATIEKAITIRGAGMEYDSIYHTMPTILEGDITLALPDTETGHFQLEGIWHNSTITYLYTQNNPQFIKCRLYKFTGTTYSKLGTDYTSRVVNAYFFHCRVVNALICYENSSISAVNSYICHPYSISTTTSPLYLENCNIYGYSQATSSYYAHLYSSQLIRCILLENDYFQWNDNTSFSECLLPSKYKPDVSKSSYMNYEKLAVVFDTYTGTYSDAEDFTMRDEMKVLYCDENGSELGMYGGSFPFSPRVAGPHLNVFNVDSHSTSDGKLRVKVQVDTTLE